MVLESFGRWFRKSDVYKFPQSVRADGAVGSGPATCHLLSTVMASTFPVLFMLVVTAALMTVAALFTPKGPQQV